MSEHQAGQLADSRDDAAGLAEQQPAEGIPEPRPVPTELMQRVADTANMIELLMRDLWTQADLEAESIRDTARRQAEALISEAQRAARGTLEQARERAEIIVGAAKLEATKVAADAERLSREFLGKLSMLTIQADAHAGDPTAPESSGRPN